MSLGFESLPGLAVYITLEQEYKKKCISNDLIRNQQPMAPGQHLATRAFGGNSIGQGFTCTVAAKGDSRQVGSANGLSQTHPKTRND